MPSLYIVLEGKIPNTDAYVNGSSLSKNNTVLESMAKKLGVTTLMSFFSASGDELASLMGEGALDATINNAKFDEKWFTAEDGLKTVHALLKSTDESSLSDRDRITTELQEFAKVLELAKAHGIRWHLAVDY
jgi:hypothetical protein